MKYKVVKTGENEYCIRKLIEDKYWILCLTEDVIKNTEQANQWIYQDTIRRKDELRRSNQDKLHEEVRHVGSMDRPKRR